MLQIFICYSRQYQDIVKILAKDIETLEHNVWFDHELIGGQSWWDQILERIRKCDIFIFAIAPEALDSSACKLELKYASDLCKTILPIIVVDGVSINLLPPNLSAIQHVDYQRQDKQAYKSLDKAINALPVSKSIPDPLPKPPDAPISYLSKLKDKIETTRTLSFEEQSALLLKLEESLRESNDIDDVRNLLKRLEKREDLLVSVAKKIDVLLISKKEALPGRITTHTYEKDTRINNSLVWRKRLEWSLIILVSIIIVIAMFIILRKRQEQQIAEILPITTDKQEHVVKWTIQIISYSNTKEYLKKATNLAKAFKDMTGYNTFVAKMRRRDCCMCRKI